MSSRAFESEGAKPSSRARRPLSEDERQLWESVARQARPLRKAAEAAGAGTAAKANALSPAATRPQSRSVAAKPIKPARPAKVAPGPMPPLAPLARRERLQLSRGRAEIEARLDLHGMTQTRAHRALLNFLQRASGSGLRFVLVITGKGRVTGPQSERGILRRQVPEWLSLPEFRAYVVGFEEAHVGHGGGGALYVRVRRAR